MKVKKRRLNDFLEGCFFVINSSVVIGRLTANPELRQTQSGVYVLSFTVAVDSRFANQNGERQTNFIPCVAWRQTAEFVSKYFIKGQWIGIQGSLQSRKYVDKNGNNRSVLELIVDNVSFCSSRADGGSKFKNDNFDSKSGGVSAGEQAYGSSSLNKSFNGDSGASEANEGESFSVGDLNSVEGFEEIGTDDSELPF